MCAQCLLCSKTRPATRFEKSRFTIWSWRRDLNPRPSDYKSDALPAELRQHNPPVTGHKVNKLAQRQFACNTVTFCLYGRERNLPGTAPSMIVTILQPLRPQFHSKSRLIYTRHLMFKHRKLLILAILLLAVTAGAFVFFYRTIQRPEAH